METKVVFKNGQFWCPKFEHWKSYTQSCPCDNCKKRCSFRLPTIVGIYLRKIGVISDD